ncbi:MAG: HAMP domain-containing sensor histidine kinase [Fimbriimonadaceae bacterium]|nr:HAMP domain-containing sensor histidine kinase [Fimbriimonadaceae bacterium]
MRQVHRLLDGRSKVSIVLIGFFLGAIIAIADAYFPGDLFVLYLLPVAFVAWYAGAACGLLMGLYATTAIFLYQSIEAFNSNIVASQRSTTYQLGSLGIRLLVYVLVSEVVSRLRSALRLSRELTEFIVHDLRSPISGSIMGLEMLRQESAGMDDYQRELLDQALIGNRRALMLVNSILDVSKLQAGRMSVDRCSVELDALVQDVFEPLRPWALTQNVTLEADLTVREWVLDERLVSRTLTNLLSNALKYTRDGTTVKVTADLVGPNLRFGVHDHGPGIPDRYRKVIFEPFGQVKGTKTGTGLGLTFCQLATGAQGGKIWVESQMGVGTSMYFLLPPAEVSAGSGGALPSSREDAKRARIQMPH